MEKEKIAPYINVNGIVYNETTKLFEAITIDLLHEIHTSEQEEKSHPYSNPSVNLFWLERVFGFTIKNQQHPTIYTNNSNFVKVRTNPGKYEFYTDHVSSGRDKTHIILSSVNDLIHYIKLCTGGKLVIPLNKVPALNNAFNKFVKDNNSKVKK